jgi:hypothetical protein
VLGSRALRAITLTTGVSNLFSSASSVLVIVLLASTLGLPPGLIGLATSAAAVGGLLGAGVVIYNITQVSFRQRLCPPALLGRMNATIRFVVFGTMPLGGLFGGALGSGLGVRPALLGTALGGLLALVPAIASPLPHLRELPTIPSVGR